MTGISPMCGRRIVLPWLAVVLLGGLAPAAFAQPPGAGALSPSQAAYMQAENRRIEDHFVSKVARITGTTPQRVRKALPDERRITAGVSRLVTALEMDLGQTLGEEQKAAIVTADEERKQALVRVREGASRR